jgi:hypothetical protein
LGEAVAPTVGPALGDGTGLDAPAPGKALELADGLAVGVAPAVGDAVALGDAVGDEVGLGVALAELLTGAVGDFPEPPLPPRGKADWLVDAPTAVSTPTVIAKTRTASPATATHRRRRVGSPRRRLLQRSRLQPEGPSIASEVGACSVGSSKRDGNGSSGSCTGAGIPSGSCRVGTPPDQSVRRAATAMRRSRSFVWRSDARYRVDAIDATMLAMAAPISVPATPNVDEMTAADTAASALAATWVKLGRTGRGGEPDVEETMIEAELLLF